MTWGDWAQSVRRSVVPVLGGFVAELNDSLGTDFYVETETYHREFVGFIRVERQQLEDIMVDTMDFEYNAISSWKTLASSDDHEKSSLAWRGRVEGNEFVHDPWADMQLHVVFYELDENPGTTAVFAHWEYSWRTHPILHYRGADATAKRGVEIAREMFREEGIDVYAENYFKDK